MPSPVPSHSIESPARPAAWHVDALGTICCVLLALVTITFALFRFTPMLPVGASRNVDKTFFTSVNVVTLTGFTHSYAAVGDYPVQGKIAVGVIAMMSALTYTAGGGYFLLRVFGMRVSFRRCLGMTLGLLMACWAVGCAVGAFDAASAASGLGLFTTSAADAWKKVALITLSIPAAIGPVVLFAILGLWRPTKRERLLNGIVASVAICFVVIAVITHLLDLSWQEAALASADVRGLGSGFIAPREVPTAVQWLMMPLMMLGGAPASTSGGLSLLPFVLIVLGAVAALRGCVPDRLLGVGVAWIGLFGIALIAIVVALAATQPQLTGDRLLFIAISAICNVGLSHDPIGLSKDGLVILSIAMLLGRFLPLAMLCWMAVISDRVDDARETTGRS